ncbi:MAG TPA: zinc ribbon domain-containing protein [Planctomycetota bacterium]|nr:zinc ribbon domain-containing protein [Planctomycetota bacterium]
MPTYDYCCAACGHRFERFESINDGGAKQCPKCNKKKSKRMLGTGAGLIFKGAGFYTTDYKRAGEKKAGEKAGEKSGGDSGESGKKSDGKDKKKEKEPKK